jgi:hypothetical protein
MRHPLAMAFRIGQRLLGQRLMNTTGDIEAMMEIAERVSAGPNKFERTIIILNTWKPIIEAAEEMRPLQARC